MVFESFTVHCLDEESKKGFLLKCTYTTAYRRFKDMNPHIKIGYVSLKPGNARNIKAMERSVCCCNKCENAKYKAINRAANHFDLTQCRLTADERSVSRLTKCAPEMSINGKHGHNCCW